MVDMEHQHYPISNEDRFDLYEDLRDFAGLTHDQAVETVGYAVSREFWGCTDTGPLAAFLIVHDPAPFLTAHDQDLYQNGAIIGYESLEHADV